MARIVIIFVGKRIPNFPWIAKAANPTLIEGGEARASKRYARATRPQQRMLELEWAVIRRLRRARPAIIRSAPIDELIAVQVPPSVAGLILQIPTDTSLASPLYRHASRQYSGSA